ncbi:MAG: DUF465 domain-containing protein [Rhizobiaceae bacterium]|nr:DUF465 domain-containing protein [Rhizobiaceae bacterium]
MSHVPHELAEEFPQQAEAIRNLKASDAHFARLADEYHEVNREVHRIEAGVEPSSDVRAEDLRKTRFRLKEEINNILQKV